MVTVPKKRRPVVERVPNRRRPFFLKEWRKFMGVGPVAAAEALDIERQSYHRLEKNWWTLNGAEMETLAELIGIEPSQFWFPPPEQPVPERVSLDEMVEDLPDPMKQAAIAAVRGIAGK